MAKKEKEPVNENASTTSILDDEMPSAPTTATSYNDDPSSGGEEEDVDIDASVDASDFDDVPAEQESMKAGKFHFRLDEYEEHEKDGEPYFSCKFVCQQEPYTGRLTYDIIPWVSQETLAIARDPSHPEYQTARRKKKDRMWKAKQLMQSCGFKPSGGFNFKEFLDSEPECKIEGAPQQGRKDSGKVDKYGKKKYVPSGKTNWKPRKYLPLV